MKTRPIIGIPCRQDTSSFSGRPINAQSDTYINAVIQAGGVPILIPVELDQAALRAVYARLDGVMLAGGGDIDPGHYQEEPHQTLSGVQPERDRVEMSVTRWAAEDGKPLLGICRGIQVMAVAVGGALWQDIPSQFPGAQQDHGYIHSNWSADRDYLAHEVRPTSASRLAQITGEETFAVNSFHHQAIKHLPEPYHIVGYASDGIIEAIDRPDHLFFCGVQWHPEDLVGDHEPARRLFAAFVEMCRQAAPVELTSAVFDEPGRQRLARR
jgi:putative glutamine amidotransferase